jgi:Spy/CpxP family protein refolding chaperone
MKATVAVFLFSFSLLADAQHAQPYAGQEQRDVKALSAQEVGQYLSGAGMGYAKAAELNGYPGPMHVLELADELKLDASQRAAMKELMDLHKAEARAIGARVVEAEHAIERLFRSGDAEPKALAVSVSEAARLQGEYRLSHLRTHWRAKALLSPEQISAYAKLRGYDSKAPTKGLEVGSP